MNSSTPFYVFDSAKQCQGPPEGAGRAALSQVGLPLNLFLVYYCMVIRKPSKSMSVVKEACLLQLIVSALPYTSISSLPFPHFVPFPLRSVLEGLTPASCFPDFWMSGRVTFSPWEARGRQQGEGQSQAVFPFLGLRAASVAVGTPVWSPTHTG